MDVIVQYGPDAVAGGGVSEHLRLRGLTATGQISLGYSYPGVPGSGMAWGTGITWGTGMVWGTADPFSESLSVYGDN